MRTSDFVATGKPSSQTMGKFLESSTFVSNYFFARNNGILISLGRYFVRLSLVVMLKGLTTVLFPDAVWLLKVFFNLKASKI